MVNKKLIIGVTILICLIVGFLLLGQILTQFPSKKELKLSDFPEAFKEKTVIVLGDNASEIERQAAEEIKNFLLEHNSSYIKIINSQKIESFKKGYNLVIIGTPKTNPFLEEVYALTNATKVTEEFPGEGKGVLEILPNPWDESKAMLLVEGSDEEGIRKAYEILKTPKKVSIMITSLRGVIYYNKSKLREVYFITCENGKYRISDNLIYLRKVDKNVYVPYIPEDYSKYSYNVHPIGPDKIIQELNGTIEIVNAGITNDIIVSADIIIQISDLRCIE